MPENEYGPFDSEREALTTRAAALIKAGYDAKPGVGASVPEALKVMTDACEAAGVDLGAWDLGFLKGVAWGETADSVSLAGMIRRAFEAGKAAGPDGTVTEWGVSRPGGLSGSDGVHNCGVGGEAFARQLLRDHQRIYGDAGSLHVREISPWTPAPEEGNDDAR